MKYYLFLDETGDHGLSYIDRNFPIFLLCGCLFDHNELRNSSLTLRKIILWGFKLQIYVHIL